MPTENPGQPPPSTRDETPGLIRWSVLGITGVVVIGVYMYMAHSVGLETFSPHPADQYYNLLVQGFREGQLSLKKDAPPGLALLADPYNATLDVYNQPGFDRILDTSYYKGRLYLYFGVTPALLLFWPFVALTGHYLFHGQAVVVFCSIGFLGSATLLTALWRRYFAEVSLGGVAACTLALGPGTGGPVILPQSEIGRAHV